MSKDQTVKYERDCEAEEITGKGTDFETGQILYLVKWAGQPRFVKNKKF